MQIDSRASASSQPPGGPLTNEAVEVQTPPTYPLRVHRGAFDGHGVRFLSALAASLRGPGLLPFFGCAMVCNPVKSPLAASP